MDFGCILHHNVQWAAQYQNQQNDCAPSEDSDQPGHLPNMIRFLPVRSVGSWRSNLSSCGQRILWSDWADAQADLCLRWVQSSCCWFCHEAAQMVIPDVYIELQKGYYDLDKTLYVRNINTSSKLTVRAYHGQEVHVVRFICLSNHWNKIYRWYKVKHIWASSWDYGTFRPP